MKRMVVETPGGPEQMKMVDVPKPSPGPKEAVVAIAFSGVNFIDVYFRTGLYKADTPIVLGSEASGTVESVGSEVTEVRPGDQDLVISLPRRGTGCPHPEARRPISSGYSVRRTSLPRSRIPGTA